MIIPHWNKIYRSRSRQPDSNQTCRFLLLLVLCFLSVPPLSAEAASRRVVFQLANLQQWVDVSYQYTGSDTDSKVGNDRSSQEHEFEQVYHVGIDYAILSRRLANGSLELDLGTNQAISREASRTTREDDGVGVGLEYLFDMVLFERRPYPVSLMASRVMSRINAPFAENYDLTSSSYGAGLAVRHDLLPFRLNYRYFMSETSGLTLDRSQASDELILESTLDWWDFSDTTLRTRIASSETDFENSFTPALATDSYDLSAHNLLSWGSLERKNSLNSWYQFRRDSGSSQLRSLQWSEDLTLQLGKGLSVGGAYRYTDTQAPQQERVEGRSRGWIEHRLFKSLTTRFDYTVTETEYLTGDDQSFRYQSSVAYAKQLPKRSNLSLNYSYGYGETDRNLDDRSLRSPRTAVTVGPTNFVQLDTPLIDPISVRVFEADGITEYLDAYTVDAGANSTNIHFPVAAPGDTLYVEYAYLINNSIEYSTTTHSVAASLGLFSQQYRIYGNVSWSDQELIDGSDDVSPLTQLTFAQIGFEGNIKQSAFGGSYLYLDTSLSTDKTAEAYLSYVQSIERNLLTIRMTERYSIIEQKANLLLGSGSGGTNRSNSLLLNVDYRRPLMRNTTMNLRGQLADIRGQRRQDDLSIGMTVEARWYKFELLLNADLIWSLYENSTTREDLLSLKIRRYF